ncbi:hypothetical protein VP01_12836g1, partial [Puccinia sorghi]
PMHTWQKHYPERLCSCPPSSTLPSVLKFLNLTFPKKHMVQKKVKHKYLVLSALAKDYLGCTASLSEVEKSFSAAENVCSSDCGKCYDP